MAKELYVSSTPHETKLALVEDDQVTEIYYERENEYTLAGSIYKGKVTRVLPGMQSAFVDVGLERDAFLYVSDFLELEEDSEDIDSAPIRVQTMDPLARTEPSIAPASGSEPSGESADQDSERPAEPRGSQPTAVFEGGAPDADEPSPEPDQAPGQGEDSRRLRGGRNRSRRGRRGRGFPENKFAHPSEPPQDRPAERSEGRERVREDRPRQDREDRPRQVREDRPRQDYGPPPGYQPIILPGESLSKYQRLAQPPLVAEPSPEPAPAPASNVSAVTHDFVTALPEIHAASEERGERTETVAPDASIVASSWERIAAPEPAAEQTEKFEQMNVAAVFGGEETVVEEEHHQESTGGHLIEEAHPTPGGDWQREPAAHDERQPFSTASTQSFDEEEIDDDEAELQPFVEQMDDVDFEELEEEVIEPEEAPLSKRQEAEELGDAVKESYADAEAENGGYESVDEANGEEEPEYDFNRVPEGVAGEEALAASGEEGNGRAEMRAPSGTAAYQQRAQRPGDDRRRGGRGGRGRPMGRGGPRRDAQRHHVAIADILKEGQEVLIQIAKEPIGKKGARITSHIALPGRFLVYMPTVNHVGVSRKIASDQERLRLKRIVTSERENGHGGFIVRTAADGAPEEELRADIRFLKNLWHEIKTRADSSKPPALIYHDLSLVERTMRDQLSEEFTHIWVDNEQEYERIVRFVNRFQPNLVKRIRLYTKEVPLFEQFGIQEEINKALKSKVWLKSGGYIVINQTEALVAIDINTGKYVGKTTRLEDTIVKTNVDAIKEIVRQIRIRDLGGIIVIDFIDMDERRNRHKVMQALEEALRSDRSPSKVLQFNDFGLVAITRKRVKQSLERTLGCPCPYCTGTGLVKSVTTVCNEIYTEMRKLAHHKDGPSDLLLRVHPEVGKALKANNARWLQDMEELTGRTIIVKADPLLHQEQFDI